MTMLNELPADLQNIILNDCWFGLDPLNPDHSTNSKLIHLYIQQAKKVQAYGAKSDNSLVGIAWKEASLLKFPESPQDHRIARVARSTLQLLSNTLSDGTKNEIEQKWGPYSIAIERVQETEQAITLELVWPRILERLPVGLPNLPTNNAQEIRAWLKDPANLPHIQSVTMLNLSRLELQMIPPEIKHFVSLQGLDLSHNKISDISALRALVNLTRLDLSHNQISDISALRALVNLVRLSLAHNKISDISTLGALVLLTHLSLAHNQISDISVLRALVKLTNLSLDNNQISDISVLRALVNLTNLYLSHNQISDISALRALVNLVELYLSHNQISDISALRALVNLVKLYLSHNQISDISVLRALVNLVELGLYNNQISDVSALRALVNITKLYLIIAK